MFSVESKKIYIVWNDEEIEVEVQKMKFLFFFHKRNWKIVYPQLEHEHFKDWLEENMCCRCRENNFVNNFYIKDENGERLEDNILYFDDVDEYQRYYLVSFGKCHDLLHGEIYSESNYEKV